MSVFDIKTIDGRSVRFTRHKYVVEYLRHLSENVHLFPIIIKVDGDPYFYNFDRSLSWDMVYHLKGLTVFEFRKIQLKHIENKQFDKELKSLVL